MQIPRVFLVATELLAAGNGAVASTWNVAAGDWSTAANWTGNIPGSGAAADFHNGGAATISGNYQAESANLILGSGSLSIVDSRLRTSTATLGDIAGATGILSLTQQSSSASWARATLSLELGGLAS